MIFSRVRRALALYPILLVGIYILASGCAPEPPSLPDVAPEFEDRQPTTVTLQIDNGYHGSALVRVYLVHYTMRRRLATLTGSNATITIRGMIQPLADYYLVVEAMYEETWWSENLFFVQPGDCLELHIGPKPIHSGLLFC